MAVLNSFKPTPSGCPLVDVKLVQSPLMSSDTRPENSTQNAERNVEPEGTDSLSAEVRSSNTWGSDNVTQRAAGSTADLGPADERPSDGQATPDLHLRGATFTSPQRPTHTLDTQPPSRAGFSGSFS